MKIVCGSCQAKYSIADEKVAGKVFRIRCKRCGEVIVVRGDQEGPEAASTVAANGNGQAALAPGALDVPSDAIWHVVINGEQAGPYSPAQLGELVASGQLDWEAYVWSEGFDNWQPMRDVPELVSAISGEPAIPVAAARPAPAVANSQMGADPFAQELPAQQVAVFAKAAGGTGGGVVQTNARAETAPSARSNFDAAGPVVSNAPSPRVTTQQAMTGARNENSVLFSLKNLQALATGSVPPSSASPSARPGHASGEGSGLIDIRALATTTGVAEPSRNSERDALLALGSAQGGAFGGLGSPMLTPPGKVEEEGGRKPLVMAIVGGFALLAVSGVAVAFIMKGNSSTPAEVAPIAPATAPAVQPQAAQDTVGSAPAQAATTPTTQAAQAPEETLSEGERAAREAREAKEQEQAAHNAEEPKAAATRSTSSRRSSNDKDKPQSAPAPSKPAPETAAKAADKPSRSGGSSLDDLLNDAIGGKNNAVGARSSSAAAAAANLPDRPSRDDVLKAMKGVSDSVKACGNGQGGVAFANVTVIGKTGMVGNVDVTGITGEAGSCIARAVRKARFPKFSSEDFQVKFPFRL